MEKDLTLLVLAAGMGSRFGGLKQIEPVGPNGEFIIDYSIKDAIYAGFTKVVFVIKEENYDIFKETIGKRIDGKIKVEYAFQKIDDVEEGLKGLIPLTRVKPLGTSHAIYSARGVINENFATINADDFYGRDAYVKAAEFLRNCNDFEYAIIAYELGKTLTVNGSVKRGVIFEKDGVLESLKESSCTKDNEEALCKPLDGSSEFRVPLNYPVSMNLFCLTPNVIRYIKDNMVKDFKNADDLNTYEYLLPNSVMDSAKENGIPVRVIKTSSNYLGMTYKEDLELLKEGIQEEINKGIYDSKLW